MTLEWLTPDYHGHAGMYLYSHTEISKYFKKSWFSWAVVVSTINLST